MHADEIGRKFQSTIDEELTRAGAKLDPAIGDILSEFVSMAAAHVAGMEEWQQEEGVDDGVDAYKKLAAKMIAAARTNRSFPSVDKYAWDLALMQLGPNPPFWYK